MTAASLPAESPAVSRVPAALPFQLALWLGIATALLEVGIRIAIWQLTPRPLQTGVDIVWMAPLMNVIWLEMAALAAWLASRLWPRVFGAGFVVGFITFPAYLNLLWLHPKFHREAMVILALGLAVQTGRFAASRLAGITRLNRRATLVTVPLLLLIVAGALGTDRWREWRAMRDLPAGRQGTPNVLLLVLDTVRSFSLSVYGHSQPTTPTLERLARESVRFDRAFATSGWTLPSHTSLFTGRYADEVETGMGKPMPDGIPTLAEAMAQAGYATGGFTANLAYTTWEHGVARGFIRYEDYPVTPLTIFNSTALGRKLLNAPKVRHLIGYVDEVDRKRAERVQGDFLSWLGEIGDRPFFAFVNFYDAHHPYLPPPPYDTLFGPTLAKRYRPFPPRFRAFDREEIAQISNAYHGGIAYIDAQINGMLEALRQRGQLDNTLIIVTSDHGEHLGDHELLSHGNSFYRQLLQVPLIIRYPARLPGDSVIRTPVSLRDVPATILDLSGIPNGGRFPGVSLVSTIGDSSARGSAIFSGRTLIEVEGAQSIIADGLHYIRYKDGSEELFDLEHDSLELASLASSPRGEAALPRFRALLDSLNAAHPVIKPAA